MQNHFLDNDPETIATEVPVYDDKYLGHIDILRLGGGLIQVCDFKPKSHRETKAASQVARYMALLAKNTGLPLFLFRGCYFDEKHFYNITL